MRARRRLGVTASPDTTTATGELATFLQRGCLVGELKYCVCAGMAANPPPSGAQPLRPHPGGPMAPHGYGSFPMQFQPGAPAQQGQPFAPPVQMPNIGMGPGQSQAMQFSQPMQQFPPRPGHIPSSQPIQMPSMQPNMPIPSASMQPQQMIHSGNNHMPGFAASSFGQTNSGINMSSQISTPAYRV